MTPPVLGSQRQPDQTAHRPIGTQHRITQLEQGVSPQRQTSVELPAKPRKIIQTRRHGQPPTNPSIRHTIDHGHRLLFELFPTNPKMIKRWPPTVTPTHRTRSNDSQQAKIQRLNNKLSTH